MARRVELRAVTSEEGNRLLRLVRRSTGSVVTWCRAQIVLLAAQGVAPVRIRMGLTTQSSPRARSPVAVIARGYRSFVRMAPGPMKTPSSTVTPW